MPPHAPHADDAARGALAALDIRASLATLGVAAAAGVATGRAYSGFVGGPGRREMCAMGSTVNMAARLMGLAGRGGVVVDAPTRAAAAPRVRCAPRGAVRVKGRDAPVEVFDALGPADPAAAAAAALARAAASLRAFGGLHPAVAAYLSGPGLAGRDDCSASHLAAVCRNLAEGGRVTVGAGGVAAPAAPGALEGLGEDGLSPEAALAQGSFEAVRPYPASNVQMLAKVRDEPGTSFSPSEWVGQWVVLVCCTWLLLVCTWVLLDRCVSACVAAAASCLGSLNQRFYNHFSDPPARTKFARTPCRQVLACAQHISEPLHRFTASAHARRLRGAHPAPARQVACFLARRGLVSLALVRHVYCATFPSFAPLFAEGLARLVALQARVQPHPNSPSCAGA
jgi:hypothetical protein